MTIAIFGSPYPEHFKKYIQHLIKKLDAEHVKLIVEENFYIFLEKNMRLSSRIETFKSHVDLQSNVDLMFSIGGDGTLLKAVTYVRKANIPIMGINTGRLGFISSISAGQIDDAINDILKKKYSINERTLLELKTDKNLFKDKNFALNEVAVSKKDTSSMIRIDAYIQDEFLNTYWADGLIVSTPTGSTGYSLSCGGPVISPTSASFVLTPISPHNLNVRPLVISDNTKIELSVSGREKNHLLSIDSKIFTIENNTKIKIEKADLNFKIAHFTDNSFYESLKEKLLWGKDKRN